jgi:hypothetical protein
MKTIKDMGMDVLALGFLISYGLPILLTGLLASWIATRQKRLYSSPVAA